MPPMRVNRSTAVAARPGTESDQLGQNRGRDLAPQPGVGLDEASDICEILLAHAGAPLRVRHRPELPLEKIFDRRDRQVQTEYFSRLGTTDEVRVPRVGLDLDAKVRARLGDVEAMRERLYSKRLAQHGLDAGKLIRRYHQIEIETDHWLDVGVDRLPPDEAIANAIVGQQTDQPVEEVDFVLQHCFPEDMRSHDG